MIILIVTLQVEETAAGSCCPCDTHCCSYLATRNALWSACVTFILRQRNFIANREMILLSPVPMTPPL
jgi:hypothetical protein